MPAVARPKDGEPIRLVFDKDGRPRYRTRLDVGEVNGKRRQQWKTFDTLSAARAHVSKHRADRERGVLLTPDRQTFKAYADGWLVGRSRRVREVTLRTYKGNVERACKRFGDKQLTKITRADIEALIGEMASAGRSKRSAALMLFTLRSIFDQAVDEGLIHRNPAKRVQPAGKAAKEREAFALDELRRLRERLAKDRLSGCWMLSMTGLRRSEVLGLKWSDVDLSAKTVTVERGRVAIDGKSQAITPPKTLRGTRTVHLSSGQVEALRTMRDEQAQAFGLGQVRDGWLAVDEAGRPLRPEVYSDRFHDHCVAANVRPLTLHSLRHSSVTAMRAAGVPDHVVAEHHGHDEVIMARTYSHPDEQQLAGAAQALEDAMTAGQSG